MSGNYITKELYDTPATQQEPIFGRESDMILNAAGGYVYEVDDFVRTERFLILGSEAGTYYTGRRQLTLDNAKAVKRALDLDGTRVVEMIRDISINGRAAKQAPTFFALAMAMSADNLEIRQKAAAILPEVIRTGSHILQFTQIVDSMRGWGRLLKTTIADWYNNMPINRLAYQTIKYRSNSGWTHKDVLASAHAMPSTPQHNSLYKYLTRDELPDRSDDAFSVLFSKLDADAAVDDIDALVKIIEENRLNWEMVPGPALQHDRVWKSLLPDMPMEATVRNLTAMTRHNVLKPNSDETHLVYSRLTDENHVKRSRLHPLNILMVKSEYARGNNSKPSYEYRRKRKPDQVVKWDPVPQILDALEQSYYLAFDNVESTDLRYYIGIDVSSSMSSNIIAGTASFSAAESAAALAMVYARREPRTVIKGFSAKGGSGRFPSYSVFNNSAMIDLNINRSDSLSSVMSKTRAMNFGATDCALPMLDAIDNSIPVDCFLIFTDNESWAGKIHASEALRQYRQKIGINAKLAVVAMTATNYSVADPKDAGMMDFVGFDTSMPRLIAQFASK